MNTSTCPRIVIIGAGISGLLSALALSKEGHAVTVLEREPEVGGVCRSYRVGPYKVDTGPHIITRLQDGPLRTLIDDYFETAPVFVPHGEYHVRTQDKVRTFPWTLKSFALFDLLPKTDRIELIQAITSAYSQRALGLLNDDIPVLDVVRDRSLSERTLSFLDIMCQFMTGVGMDKTPLTRFFDSLDYKNKRQVQDPLDYLNGIRNIITKKGAQDQQYPKGGVQTLVTSILSSLPEGRVDIRTSCEATRIRVEGGRVSAVETPEEDLPADIVIYSTYASDLPQYVDALPTSYAQRLRSLEKVRSLTLWLGLDTRLFTNNGSEIWIDSTPPCWVVPTSDYDESLAPSGHQVVGCTTTLPAGADIDAFKTQFLAALYRQMPGIEDHITMTHWQVLVPEKAAWVVRQEMPSCRTPIKGLYLVGTDTMRKSMGVTRASYSVLTLLEALAADDVLEKGGQARRGRGHEDS